MLVLSQVFIHGPLRDASSCHPRRTEESDEGAPLDGGALPTEIMRLGVRWDVASPCCDRPVEALREARGVPSAHAPSQRWVVQESPRLAEVFHCRQRPVWGRWGRDATDITGKGQATCCCG